MKLYMVVTPDKYELPLLVTDKVSEVSAFTGKKEAAIFCAIANKCSGVKYGYKYLRVEIDDE